MVVRTCAEQAKDEYEERESPHRTLDLRDDDLWRRIRERPQRVPAPSSGSLPPGGDEGHDRDDQSDRADDELDQTDRLRARCVVDGGLHVGLHRSRLRRTDRCSSRKPATPGRW